MDLHSLVDENQSIKIVPSVEDSLKTLGLHVDLDSNEEMWFIKLKSTWKTWKKSTTVESLIKTFYQSRPDPFRIALVLVIKCDDYKDCKPKSLPFSIVETLQKWSQENQVTFEDYLKKPAFEVAIKQRNQMFLELMFETYQLNRIRDMVLPQVENMIAEGNYKLASQIIKGMNMANYIPVDKLLFPLVLQDKHNTIDEYLTAIPDQAEPFVLFLDNFLNKNFKLRDYVQSYVEKHKITDVKYDKLHYKPLGKLVARLCTKYKIPITMCKNLSKNRTSGGLRYLIHQKYLEKNVSSSVWDDLVKDSLSQNADTAVDFITTLAEYDQKEAHKWAKYLNMAESEYPTCLIATKAPISVASAEENWDTTPNTLEYYKLKLPLEYVMLVDTPEKFHDMMSTGLPHCKILSIDCEWKPSFGAKQSQVALVQVATNKNVFLLDTIVLNGKEHTSFWHTFNKTILENPEIIKVGFGLEQDLREIKASVAGLSNIKVKGEGLLDLSLLWKSVLNNGLVMPSSSTGNNAGNSLSSLVEIGFGLPLAKAEQCSNWELRPLRTTQIMYAALDAYVLLELFYFFQKMCVEQRLKFDEIINDIMMDGKQKSCKKPRPVEKSQKPPINTLVPVNQIKFLVEPLLSNLMCYLRYLGIDTTVAPPSMMWHDVIKLAIQEERYVLVAKPKLSPMTYFPQSSIFDAGNFSIKEQIGNIIQHFRIDIKDNQFLTRCIYCNDIVLKELTTDEIVKLNQDFRNTNKHNQHFNDYYEEEDTNYDNFLSDSDGDDEMYQAVKNVPNVKITTCKGVPIDCDDIEELVKLKVKAKLCENCGKVLWVREKLIQPVSDLLQTLLKLTIN